MSLTYKAMLAWGFLGWEITFSLFSGLWCIQGLLISYCGDLGIDIFLEIYLVHLGFQIYWYVFVYFIFNLLYL